MSIVLNAASSYGKTITNFVRSLYNMQPLSFIIFNMGGIFSKLIFIIAFIVAIKVIALVYTGKLYLFVREHTENQLLQLSDFSLTGILATIVLFLFILSAISPLIYSIKLSRYSYIISITYRKVNADKFFLAYNNTVEENKSQTLRKFVLTEDPQLGRSIINIIYYIFELIQNSSVIIISLIAISSFFPIMGVIIFLLILTLIPFFLWKSFHRVSRMRSLEENIRKSDKEVKQALLKNSDEAISGENLIEQFMDIYDSSDGQSLEFLRKRGERDVRIIQMILHTTLGMFLSSALLYIHYAGVDNINLGDMLIVFLIMRFVFGILQGLLASMRHINVEYKTIKELVT